MAIGDVRFLSPWAGLGVLAAYAAWPWAPGRGCSPSGTPERDNGGMGGPLTAAVAWAGRRCWRTRPPGPERAAVLPGRDPARALPAGAEVWLMVALPVVQLIPVRVHPAWVG